jgi:hypothetical protein
MGKAILLVVAASLCTATASLCQRTGARSAQTAGFDAGLVVRLARQPVWLLGIASMIGGFIFQLTAPGSSWLLAGLVTAGVVFAALAVAFGLGRRPVAPRSRRAVAMAALVMPRQDAGLA